MIELGLVLEAFPLERKDRMELAIERDRDCGGLGVSSGSVHEEVDGV